MRATPLQDGRVGLIDFGQVKQIGGRNRETLSRVMLALAERTSDSDPAQLAAISKLALELGVRLVDDAPIEGPAATAMWLFDGAVRELPGGFDINELSPDSPVKVLKSFPQARCCGYCPCCRHHQVACIGWRQDHTPRHQAPVPSHAP